MKSKLVIVWIGVPKTMKHMEVVVPRYKFLQGEFPENKSSSKFMDKWV
jgi:hypothetical protein